MSFSGKNTGCLSTKAHRLPMETLILAALPHKPVGIRLNMGLLTVGSGLKKRNTLMQEGIET